MKQTKQIILAFIITTLTFIGGTGPTQAQDDPYGAVPLTLDWRELQTEHFVIVYAAAVYRGEGQAEDCPYCGLAEAERYATFVDGLYTDLTHVFETELEPPINLRLFPTEESYFVVNPLAEFLTGVIAHALNSREEIAVALPRTQQLTESQLLNNMRHEFTHLFASQLSDGNLNAGFQEGIAQYLEKPDDRASYDPAILRQAFEQGRLLTWDELDAARKIYTDPQVAYPQSLSVVSFLVDRYGFATFVDFIRATGTESGYRTALSKTYDKSAEVLESEWKAYLPAYFDNRWQINAVYNYDLRRVTNLVNQGAFSDAQAEISQVVTLLETTNQTETLAQAQLLLNRAEQGRQAARYADEARAALLSGAYDRALEQAQLALQEYQLINYTERNSELQIYLYRAELGRQALLQLEEGERLLNGLRYFEAEQRLTEATRNLQGLNNQAAAARGIELLEETADRQSSLAYVLLVIGGLLIIANAVHRMLNSMTGHPLEVEF